MNVMYSNPMMWRLTMDSDLGKFHPRSYLAYTMMRSFEDKHNMTIEESILPGMMI